MTHEPGAARAAATSGALLVPIWGYRFVSQFLEFGLPMLLAPGNLPTIARDLPFRIIVLSSAEDEPLIRSHPAWRRLESICSAEVQLVDDLITHSNHTATITLAFERVMRSYGAAIIDTCFILWMSDYLVGDGSLATVIRHLQDGASGVLAGNFQIVAEDALPSLREIIDAGSLSVAIPNRQLIAWSLGYLHPATVANTVNVGFVHNAHTNRLFWWADEGTLIGRFYLMHPIGIRPETIDFKISASFDYSFLPEMCPSGQITTLTRSDDYCVVEMQRRDHESDLLLPGPVEKHALAADLSVWATAQHREYATQTVVFQAGETPANLPKIIAEADQFIRGVRELLVGPPLPHRNHPFWIGSIAVNRARTGRPLTRDNWSFLSGDSLPRRALPKLMLRLRLRIFGPVPRVTRFHPRWPDYRLLNDALEQGIAAGQRILLVSDRPAGFAHWLSRTSGDVMTLDANDLLGMTLQDYKSLYSPLAKSFDTCAVALPEGLFGSADELLERLEPLLTREGQLSIFAMNDRPLAVCQGFARAFATESSRLLNLFSSISETRYIGAGRFRWRIYRAVQWFSDHASDAVRTGQTLRLLWFALGGLPIAPITYLLNFGISAAREPPKSVWSSVLLRLRRSDRDATAPSSRFSAVLAGVAASSSGAPNIPASNKFGSSEASLKNPVKSSLAIGRYNFVAQLLSGRRDVAECGHVDPNGMWLVLLHLKKLTVYQPDLRRVDELKKLKFHPDKFIVKIHDLLDRPLSKLHDTIYTFDALEYVSPDDEDIYLRNLSRSLSDHGVLIVGLGTHSALHGVVGAGEEVSRVNLAVTRVEFLSIHSREQKRSLGIQYGTRRYRRTYAGVKALLNRHFDSVMLFSLIGDIVHAGTLDVGDYLVALCTYRKD